MSTRIADDFDTINAHLRALQKQPIIADKPDIVKWFDNDNNVAWYKAVTLHGAQVLRVWYCEPNGYYPFVIPWLDTSRVGWHAQHAFTRHGRIDKPT